jgi:hypothetical protein
MRHYFAPLALLATSILAGCAGFVDEHSSPSVSSNEMVYARLQTGGVAAFKVDPTDGSLHQIDIMPQNIEELQVTPDGKFLLGGAGTFVSTPAGGYYTQNAVMVPLKPDGRFAGSPTQIFSLGERGELLFTQDGRFIVTHTIDAPICDQWDYECNYIDRIRTYRIHYPDTLPTTTFADEYQIARDYQDAYRSESFQLSRAFKNAEGEAVALQWTCYEFYQDCLPGVTSLNIDSEGKISESHIAIPGNSATEFQARGYDVFNIEYGWGSNSLEIDESLPDQQPRLAWICAAGFEADGQYQFTPPPVECQISGTFTVSAAGDRLFVSTGVEPQYAMEGDPPPKIWSRPFSFQTGISPDGVSIDTPYRPESLTLSSRGTTLIGIETRWHDESQYHSTVPTNQLFVYKINTDGSLSEVPSQVPLPVAYSIAVH